MSVQQLVAEILFVRTSYVKKIIEDCSNSEETVKLLRFCCWENPQFSSTVLSELLWQVNTRVLIQSFPAAVLGCEDQIVFTIRFSYCAFEQNNVAPATCSKTKQNTFLTPKK